MKTLSFITTCMNREEYLKQTLPHNLHIIEKYSNLEIIVLNYNSKGDLDEYIRTFDNPQLKYYKETDAEVFNMSRAKNIGSVLSDRDYILNLDADNFLSTAYIDGLLEAMEEDYDHLSIALKTQNVGLGGRIGCKKSVFEYVRGYDESLQGWGADDVDFENRILTHGFSVKYILIPEDKDAVIYQTDVEKGSNYNDIDKDINVTGIRNRMLSSNPYRTINANGYGLANVIDINGNAIEIKNNWNMPFNTNISFYKDYIQKDNDDILKAFKKDVPNFANMGDNLRASLAFNNFPLFNDGMFFKYNVHKNNVCNPNLWATNIISYITLASQYGIIRTDILSFAVIGILLGRNVIMYDEGNGINRRFYESHLKAYGCKWDNKYFEKLEYERNKNNSKK